MDWDDDSGMDGGESEARANLLDIEAIAGYFCSGGAVDRALGDAYEFREQQSRAACEIASAFNEEAICLLEAPPGTGKTLAYLLPAACWALANDKAPVIVSTKTINLQSQIIEKDLPMVRRILGDALRFSLVKGRGNYICPRRAHAVRQERTQVELFDGNANADLSRLLEWERTTGDGSRADLAFRPSEEAWEHVSAKHAGCSREQCRSSNCFFFQARSTVNDSHLLVVNHAFLFSHLKHGDDAGLLPMSRVVLDEAHNVVDSATSCFSVQLSNHGIQKTLRRLNGAVTRAATLAGKLGGQEAQALLNVPHAIDDADTRRLEEDANRLFNLIQMDGTESFKRRITAVDEERWVALFEECATLQGCLKTVSGKISQCRMELAGQDPATESGDVASVDAELAVVERFFKEHIEAADMLSEHDAGDRLVKSVQVERKAKGVFVELSIAPLHVERQLQEMLYQPCKAVIMASATLRVDDRFDFQQRALGIEGSERCRTLAVSSPFDHKEKALFAMVTDLPKPPSRTHEDQYDAYAARLAEAVFASVTAAGGGALVLFTAHGMLRKISDLLSPRLHARGMTPLTQDEQSRERVLDAFKSDTNSVLFATDSFREGVDVAGDALRLVVITKLPFRVPTDPVFEARCEAAGQHAFHDYSVPLAVVDFRQAFGRLIRAKTDSGAVVVLDSRIVGASYGRRFRASVPSCRIVQGSLETVHHAVGEFFRRSA